MLQRNKVRVRYPLGTGTHEIGSALGRRRKKVDDLERKPPIVGVSKKRKRNVELISKIELRDELDLMLLSLFPLVSE